jgi:hypothetical protein
MPTRRAPNIQSMIRPLDRLLVGDGINPRTGIITLPVEGVINPSD